MKYLLVVVVVVAVLWIMFGRAAKRGDAGAASANKKRAPPGPAPMIACAHCGVNLPLDDAVGDGDRQYCSEAHRLAGPASR